MAGVVAMAMVATAIAVPMPVVDLPAHAALLRRAVMQVAWPEVTRAAHVDSAPLLLVASMVEAAALAAGSTVAAVVVVSTVVEAAVTDKPDRKI